MPKISTSQILARRMGTAWLHTKIELLIEEMERERLVLAVP